MSELSTLAARHGFSLGAVEHLARALQVGGGTAAQFQHPEFGGPGQWMRGGMLQIGDLFNHSLKARVAALIDDLLAVPPPAPAAPPADPGTWRDLPPLEAMRRSPQYGVPAFRGSQNRMHYTFYPAVARLIVETDGQRLEFDTSGLQVQGVSAGQQGEGASLLLQTSRGSVPVESLPRRTPLE